ncbi:unnamed protein product [Symbiodinium sp. CCMP2592]|nr:unnamed protein product [Symbiodinium sp. CCMP2592]
MATLGITLHQIISSRTAARAAVQALITPAQFATVLKIVPVSGGSRLHVTWSKVVLRDVHHLDGIVMALGALGTVSQFDNVEHLNREVADTALRTAKERQRAGLVTASAAVDVTQQLLLLRGGRKFADDSLAFINCAQTWQADGLRRQAPLCLCLGWPAHTTLNLTPRSLT